MSEFTLLRELKATSGQKVDPKAQKITREIVQLNLKRGKWWGAGLTGFWAFLVLVSSIDHLGSRFFPNAAMKAKKRVGQSAPVRLFRKYVTMPALLNGKHTTRNFIGGVIPTRFESIVIFCYFVLVVLSEAVNYEYYSKSTRFTQKRVQMARYVGDRSAIVTVFIVIHTFLFAGRNNFLMWLTGWKMSTFYAFHKWLARMAIFSAFVHTITMFEVMHWNGSVKYIKTEAWWRWGAVAMVSGAVILFQTFPYIRARLYDIFLYFHIVLATFWLIGMWIHVADLGYGPYAYATAAIWVFDRFLRLLKMSTFGIRVAHLELVSEEMIIMTIPSVAFIKRPTPGSFGYVYFLDGWTFFQSHPFSVITEQNTVKFLIKGKQGITRKLFKKLYELPNHKCSINICLEAFYGEYRPAYAYNEVIIVGGGNGVVGLYEYIKDIEAKRQQGKSNTRFVKFYWIIRHWQSIDWLYPELKSLREYDYVEPIVYVTRYEEGKVGDRFAYAQESASAKSSLTNEVELKEEAKDDAIEEVLQDDTNAMKEESPELLIKAESFVERIKNDLPHVKFRSSRPDVAQLIHEDIEEAGPHENIAVLSCAINQMCDDVRRGVADEVGAARSGRIDLVELLQVW
ncbi:uncharacterized protein ZBAI_03032 [Zygosaccharomyces bailii ISA1307]|nr:uncharacterized protein ZBAI_03032 [Zygosaccharomyces bailii ISA1307]